MDEAPLSVHSAIEINDSCNCVCLRPKRVYVHQSGSMEVWDRNKGNLDAAQRSIVHLQNFISDRLNDPSQLQRIEEIAGIHFMDLKARGAAPTLEQISKLFTAFNQVKELT